MKVITVNFLVCAVKECRMSSSSFPLHFRDAELVQEDLDFRPDFIRNVLPRINWDALQTTASEVWELEVVNEKFRAIDCSLTNRALFLQLGFPRIPDVKAEVGAIGDEQILRDLHRLLLETQVMEGKLVCGNCGYEYTIKEGIANFLLPSHLGPRVSIPWSLVYVLLTFICL